MMPVETTIRNGTVTLPPPLQKAWRGVRVVIQENDDSLIIRRQPKLTPQQRLAIWQKAAGMWKNRKPDPIKELARMRREWERSLPPIKIEGCVYK